MIQVNELTFSYPKSKHNVFEGLSLQLKENRIYGLLGRNGMGKSRRIQRANALRHKVIKSFRKNTQKEYKNLIFLLVGD